MLGKKLETTSQIDTTINSLLAQGHEVRLVIGTNATHHEYLRGYSKVLDKGTVPIHLSYKLGMEKSEIYKSVVSKLNPELTINVALGGTGSVKIEEARVWLEKKHKAVYQALAGKKNVEFIIVDRCGDILKQLSEKTVAVSAAPAPAMG